MRIMNLPRVVALSLGRDVYHTDLHWEAAMEVNSIFQVVKAFAPVLGAHPVKVWGAAKEGRKRQSMYCPKAWTR